MNIAGVGVGPAYPCRTIAELSNAHNGDVNRALRIIDAAREAGADFFKFQAYTASELVALRGDGPAPEPWGSDGWTMRKLYAKAQTPLHWFHRLTAHCDDIGLPWFSSVFGTGSLSLLESLGCPAYKIAALDLGADALLQAVRATGKPVLRSSPKVLVAESGEVTLFCPPGYPQDVTHLRKAMKYFDGFSYHGTDPSVPALAAVLGAQVVEVHFQLDDEPSELEANVSLTATQFKEMVTMIRQAERVAA